LNESADYILSEFEKYGLTVNRQEFEVTTAITVEEAKQVLSAGFEYITEKDGIMLFRKPKRFGV